MKQTTAIKISTANTLGEYLSALQECYNTKECKPGRFKKSTLIFALMSKLNGQNQFSITNVKNKALEAENIFEFIEIIKNNFNTGAVISENAKKTLIQDTEKLLAIIPMEETGPAPEQKVKKAEPAETKTPAPAKKKRP